MVSQYRPPNVLLQEGSAYKADIDSSITSVGRIAAAYLPHEKQEIAEVSKVTLVDDSSGSALDGTHFFINTPTTDFYIWFNAVDISGLLDPAFSGLTGLRVDFTTSDLASTIAATMNSVVDAQALLNSSVSGDEVTISNRDEGAVTDLSDGLSGGATGFTFEVLTQGGDGPDDRTISVDAGYVLTAVGVTEIAAQTTGVLSQPVSFPRIDRIAIDIESGTISVVSGTEAASPVAPDLPSGKAPCCQVRLETTTTIITDTIITDERVTASYATEQPVVVLLSDAVKTTTSSTGVQKTFTILKNTLDVDGKAVRIMASGLKNGTGGTCTVQFKLESTTLRSQVIPASNNFWRCDIVIARRNATLIQSTVIFYEYLLSGSGTFDMSGVGGTFTLANDLDFTIDVFAINGADNFDVELLMIELLP